MYLPVVILSAMLLAAPAKQDCELAKPQLQECNEWWWSRCHGTKQQCIEMTAKGCKTEQEVVRICKAKKKR